MIVGLIEGVDNVITLPFKKAGNDIFLIGETKAELGGSEYHSVIYNLEGGIPPTVDESKIKTLVASLQGVDIAKELESASVAAAPAAGVTGEAASKEAKKEEKEEEKPSESAEGLASLFG